MSIYPSKEYLRDRFNYHEEGYLTYRIAPCKRMKAGDKVGGLRPDGRHGLTMMGKSWLLHRVIYAWHTGEWPPLLDHEDRDYTNTCAEIFWVTRKSSTILNVPAPPSQPTGRRSDD